MTISGGKRQHFSTDTVGGLAEWQHQSAHQPS